MRGAAITLCALVLSTPLLAGAALSMPSAARTG